MEKAFDWIDRNLLYYRLLELNIDGKMFNVIKAFYTGNVATVRISNNIYTEWFKVPCGVRQGDPLSPTLFSIVIDDLIQTLQSLNVGVDIGSDIISILCYADDIVHDPMIKT